MVFAPEEESCISCPSIRTKVVLHQTNTSPQRSVELSPQCVYVHIQLQLSATQQKPLSMDDKAKSSVFERPR